MWQAICRVNQAVNFRSYQTVNLPENSDLGPLQLIENTKEYP
jgi:hypothetical protein